MTNNQSEVSNCCGASCRLKYPEGSNRYWCEKCQQPCEAVNQPAQPEPQQEEWSKRIDYNAHDMGEMGKFIRTKYAKNILQEALASQKAELEKQCAERAQKMFEMPIDTQQIANVEVKAVEEFAADLLTNPNRYPIGGGNIGKRSINTIVGFYLADFKRTRGVKE